VSNTQTPVLRMMIVTQDGACIFVSLCGMRHTIPCHGEIESYNKQDIPTSKSPGALYASVLQIRFPQSPPKFLSVAPGIRSGLVLGQLSGFTQVHSTN